MAPGRFHHSVVLRLVACLVIGGLLISAALSALELRRAGALLQLEITQKVALTARNLQSTVLSLLDPEADTDASVRYAFEQYLTDRRLRGIRLGGEDRPALTAGDFPPDLEKTASIWPLPQAGMAMGDEVDLDRLTLVRAPIVHHGRVLTLEVLVDGPAARRQLQSQVFNGLAMQWLLLAVMTLLGLLLVRRWFTGPLAEIVGLLTRSAPAEAFLKTACHRRGEFAQLASAIGGMLARIDQTTACLAERERALADLYQFAPGAMINVDLAGRITEANQRAASLLGVEPPGTLPGRSIVDYLRPGDRGLFRETVDRLETQALARCELRVVVGASSLELLVECCADRDGQGAVRQVRLSLLDVTESRQLQRRVNETGRLLNLVFEHMSDALLLLDAEGRIAAHNGRLSRLICRRQESLVGQVYDGERFWEDLGPEEPEVFAARLRQIEADRARPAQERFPTRAGMLLFESIPVFDAQSKPVGRLWAVRDVTQQQQIQRLAEQQAAQLQALRDVGQRLGDLADVDDLLQRAAQLLQEVFQTAAVGLAIRRDHHGRRSQQIMHRGSGPMLLATHQALVETVEKHLMPQALAGQDLMYWPEAPANLPWAAGFQQAGLPCVLAAPLKGSADAQGILWVARHAGERLERQQIHLMQALTPVIAARLEFALQRERLQQLRLTDLATDLPNAQQFNTMAERLANRPGHNWAAVMIRIDQFRRLNEQVDHAAADGVLRATAHQILATVRKSCFVARLPGPVFGVLAPGVDAAQVPALAERLRQAVVAAALELPAGVDWRPAASAATAACPADGRDAAAVVAAVLRRLERAKALGGNCLVSVDAPPARQAG